MSLPGPSVSRAGIFVRLADLYARMEAAYNEAAAALDFSCRDCPDNCCDSYFQHHTYVEWAYLWEGIEALPKGRRHELEARSRICVAEIEAARGGGKRPVIMCPLNEKGRCSLYARRLMICRLHGVPASLRRPDGRVMRFPGCFRCQEISSGGSRADSDLDRTGFYRELVGLELEFLGARRHMLPKVDLTLAQMITEGPPQV